MSPPGKSFDLPSGNANLQKLCDSLFTDAAARSRLANALTRPVDFPVAVVWRNAPPSPRPFRTRAAPDWIPEFVDLVPFTERPGRHARHDAGEYYCLDAGSVFESTVLSACRLDTVDRIVDVCASPGGKSVLAWRMLQPQGMICNEVVGRRTVQLISNLRRCRIDCAKVVSREVEQLADENAATADVVIVDAPCSGQSLVARGKPSPGCFHPATINLNVNRQRRILAHASRIVRPGGYLAYMTCTYSLKENERNYEWLLKQNSMLEPTPVPVLEKYRSPYTDVPCYRSWPFEGIGAGGFAALMWHRT